MSEFASSRKIEEKRTSIEIMNILNFIESYILSVMNWVLIIPRVLIISEGAVNADVVLSKKKTDVSLYHRLHQVLVSRQVFVSIITRLKFRHFKKTKNILLAQKIH